MFTTQNTLIYVLLAIMLINIVIIVWQAEKQSKKIEKMNIAIKNLCAIKEKIKVVAIPKEIVEKTKDEIKIVVLPEEVVEKIKKDIQE